MKLAMDRLWRKNNLITESGTSADSEIFSLSPGQDGISGSAGTAGGN